MVAPGQTAYLRCEVYVPHDENNNSVGRVRWYRSLDLVTSEDVTDEQDTVIRYKLGSIPIMSGTLTGLFKDTYLLIIRNISSLDNGYFWCQIITNKTCLLRSRYVNISVNTTSTENNACPSYYNLVCATTVTSDETFEYVTTTSSLFTQPTTVSYDVKTESSLILITSSTTSSVPPPCYSYPSSPALVASLLSLIVLLVLTLFLTTAVFVVVWKNIKKRAGQQCQKCKSKLIKMYNL